MRAVTGTYVRPFHVRSGNQRSSRASPEVLPLGVDAQAGGEELGLQGLRPGAVRQGLLRRFGGEAADEAFDGRHRGGSLRQTSSSSVTGPSLTSSTAIVAPKRPRAAPRRSAKRSYSGSACSGRAAAT